MSEWIVYSKDGKSERCRLKKLSYTGSFMNERAVTATFGNHSEVAFEVFDYITYRGEQFELESIPTVKKTSRFNYEYELRFVSHKYELERCEMRDLVPSDNGIVYPTPLTFSFTGNVRYLAERIQACLDSLYGLGVWSIIVESGVTSEEKNITISQQNCWNALSLVNTTYGLNFYIKGRTVTIGGSQSILSHTFQYGKGNGLYEIERVADTDTGIITKLRAYGSTRNLDYSYPKKPEWSDSVLDISFVLSPLRLMLPSFKSDGKTDYVLADDATVAKYGIRETSIIYDDIYPSITGATNGSGQAIDEIKAVDAVDDSSSTFVVYLHELGFDLEEHLTTSDAQISMKSGAMQGYTFNMSSIEKQSDNSYKITLGRITTDSSNTDNYSIPNSSWNMAAGDKFVLLNILMPQEYIRDAEERLESRAKEYLAEYGKTNFSYNIGLHDKFLVENGDVYSNIIEGARLKIYDSELGISEDVTIQSLTIDENMEDNILPQVKVALNNKPSASTLERIQGQIKDLSDSASGSFSSQSELLRQYRKKLDKPFFDRLFVAVDKNGNELPSTDLTTPISYIKAKFDFAVVGGVTMYVEGDRLNIPSIYAGLPIDNTTIYWENGVLKAVGSSVGGGVADSVAWENVYGKPSWITDAKPKYTYSEIQDTPDLTKYALKTDIPSLSGYATEQWVIGKNYVNSTSLANELKKYVSIDNDESINGLKNFKKGLQIDGLGISKSQDDVIYLDANLVVRGGITMYADNTVDIPSIIDSLPIASTTNKGIASFDGEYFSVSNGKVSLIAENVGLNEAELAAYLSNNKYATQSWVQSLGYATSSDLDSRINALVNGAPAAYDTLKEIADVLAGNVDSIGDIITTLGTKWTQDNTKIANWDTAYSWGNHASVGYALKSYVDTEFAKYVTLATAQTISGEKNFTGGLKVNGSPIVYDATNKYWKLEGDLLVTGGITMYGSDSSFDTSTIMDAILYDDDTLGINSNGELYVKGGTDGGLDITALQNYLTTNSYLNANNYSNYTIFAKAYKNYDANTIYNFSYYSIAGGSNVPTSPYGSLLTLPYRALNNNTKCDFAAQLFLPNGDNVNNPNDMFFRTSLSSVWNPWQLVLTSNNYSSYALPLSGGTMNGNILLGGTTTNEIGTNILNSTYQEFTHKNSFGYVSIGPFNTDHAHIYTDRPSFYFNKELRVNNKQVWHAGNLTASSLGLGNVTNLAASGYLTALSSNTTNAVSITVGGTTKNITAATMKSSLGLGSNAYTSTAYLPSASYTAADVLAKLKTVDGSGSGLDADLLDGLDSSMYGQYLGSNGTFDLNVIRNGVRAGKLYNATNAAPNGSNYRGFLEYGTNGYTAQFNSDSINNLYYRWCENGTWKNWRTIAFTDSNVASATKLQTSRTIWGQSFDGTKDISGKITTSHVSSTVGVDITAHNEASGARIYLTTGAFRPWGDDNGLINLGTTGQRWNGVYAKSGDFSSGLTSGGDLDVNGTIKSSSIMSSNIRIECDNDGVFSGARSSEINNYNSNLYLNNDSSTKVIIATGGGNVGVGLISPLTKLHVYGAIMADAYRGVGNNNAAIIFDKPGSYYTGIGSNATNDTIYFGACNSAGVWVSYTQTWKFGGNIIANGGITMYSDQRKKTILNHVELSLKQIANAPLIEHYYNSDDKKTTHVGSIAQYWAGLNDWFCKLDNEGYYTMEIQNAALASAISVARELDRYETKTDKKIKQLKKRICQLEDELERLKSA